MTKAINSEMIYGLMSLLVARMPSTTKADLDSLLTEVDVMSRNAAEDTRETMNSFTHVIERSPNRKRLHVD